MPTVPLFGLSQSGKSRAVTSQGHINLYAEIIDDPEKSRVVYYNTPGLALFTSFGDTPVRGWIAAGDYFYAVHRGTLWQVNNAGVKVNIGTLNTTTGRVDMAYSGTQIGITDGLNMYCLTSGVGFAQVASGLYSNPSSITFQDGYFIVTFGDGDERYQISGIYDGTTFDALDFASAESNPDGIVRVVADHGELVLLGKQTIEFASNTGGQDFPYETLKGATQEFGLAAKWSLVKYNDSLAGLFKNRMGQVQVMVMVGHAMKEISTPEMSSLINGYATVSDATGYAYLLGGHPMYVINFPSAGKTWLYDSLTNLWSSLESGLLGGRHRAEIHLDYLNKPRVSDYENGNIYTLDSTVYADNGEARPVEITGRHVFTSGFRLAISHLQIFFEAGTGLATGQGENPQACLCVSRDGGFTWGNEMWRSIGAIGSYLARAMWNRLGQSRDFIFRVRVTDPVKVVITGASMDVSK